MKIITRVIIFFALCFATSCISDSIPQRLDKFVDNAEFKADSYSDEDWEKSVIQFERLSEQYESSKISYTDAEKQMAARAMGRYHSLLIKKGIESAASYLKEFGKTLPSYLEGLKEGFDINSEYIQKTVDGLMNNQNIKQSIDSLSNTIDKLIEGIE